MDKVGLHRCKSGHYHFLVGEEHCLWPFWSLKEGLQILDHYCAHLPGKAPILEQLREMLEYESRKQTINNGRFGTHLLLREDKPDTPNINPVEWFNFVGGKRKKFNVMIWGTRNSSGRYLPIGPFIIPLECDFVERPSLSRLKQSPKLSTQLRARAYVRPLTTVV